MKSRLEFAMLMIFKSMNLSPVRELRFHPSRRWRFDFAFPDKKIAVEVEGGIWARGRHTRGGGYAGDVEKYNEAVKLGWRVLRYHSATLRNFINDWEALK